MERKIYAQLKKWKDQNRGRSALLIQGARRVGKSYIAELLAKAEYKFYILIDFNKVNQQVKDLFLYDIDDLDLFFLKKRVLRSPKGPKGFGGTTLINLSFLRLSPVTLTRVIRCTFMQRLQGRFTSSPSRNLPAAISSL